MIRSPRPDFLIIGAPKAGTTALHAALAQHPEVFMTRPKEPKYWLCDDAPPPHWRGPGDAHSQQEWIWRRDDYDALFAARRRHAAARREHAVLPVEPAAPTAGSPSTLPDVRLIAVVRDPIDRAYSQLDAPVVRRARAGRRLRGGLRPAGRAGATPAGRRSGATASSGCTASSSPTCYQYVDPRAGAGAALPRHRRRPAGRRSTGRAGSSASRRAMVATIPRDNSRSYVEPGWRPTGARPGDPRRRLARPVRAAGGLAPGQRAAGARGCGPATAGPAAAARPSSASGWCPHFADDIDLLVRAHRGGLLRLALHREPRARSTSAAGGER